MSEQAPAQPQPQPQTQPSFGVAKIYLKDLSLELPNAPEVFFQREAPQVEVNIHNEASKLTQEDLYQVVLTVTVTAKVQEKTVFLVEVAQAGIFVARNIPEQELDAVLGIACPNILFPYAREVVSDLTTRAGFPPVILSPVNFEAIYAQQRQQQAQQPAQPEVQIIIPTVSH